MSEDDIVKYPQSIIRECGHCGNMTPHRHVSAYAAYQLIEEIDDENRIVGNHHWVSYACGTCDALSLYGGFECNGNFKVPRVAFYPKGSSISPSHHLVSPSQPIPENVLKLYLEVWPLRHRSASAFIGQVRRLLEFICKDKGAEGATLYDKLKDLTGKGIFPGYFVEITDLLRKVGNLGAHAEEEEVDIYDAELIDEFFRSVVDYIYIAPAKIARMRERLNVAQKT